MIYVQMNWAARHPEAPRVTHVWWACMILIASICVAYASLKVYDIPVRDRLTRKFLRHNSK